MPKTRNSGVLKLGIATWKEVVAAVPVLSLGPSEDLAPCGPHVSCCLGAPSTPPHLQPLTSTRRQRLRHT